MNNDGADALVGIRTERRAGDVAAIVRLHDTIYHREYGFDETFAEYVEGPLQAFVDRQSPRERLWVAERKGAIVGCIAIVAQAPTVAQLRWYLVAPGCRGRGLGRQLLHDALAFCRASGYERVILWTVSALEDAARLYRASGFRCIEEIPGVQWGVRVVEQRYEMTLT